MEMFKIGWIVAVVLAVMTILEFIFAAQVSDETLRFAGLLATALAKAGFIMYFFMHVYRLWREEAH